MYYRHMVLKLVCGIVFQRPESPQIYLHTDTTRCHMQQYNLDETDLMANDMTWHGSIWYMLYGWFQRPRLLSRCLCSAKPSCPTLAPVHPAVRPSTLVSTLSASCSQPKTPRRFLRWTGTSLEPETCVASQFLNYIFYSIFAHIRMFMYIHNNDITCYKSTLSRWKLELLCQHLACEFDIFLYVVWNFGCFCLMVNKIFWFDLVFIIASSSNYVTHLTFYQCMYIEMSEEAINRLPNYHHWTCTITTKYGFFPCHSTQQQHVFLYRLDTSIYCFIHSYIAAYSLQ